MQKKFEAKNFLSKEKRGLTVNRFKSNSIALDLVNKLYSNGAKIVFITGIYEYISDEEMYADRMIVELPDEKQKRVTLFAICNEEIKNEGFDPVEDGGQKELELWWD